MSIPTDEAVILLESRDPTETPEPPLFAYSATERLSLLTFRS